MTNAKTNLAFALGIVGALALSGPSAEARSRHAAPKAQPTVTAKPFAYRSPYFEPSYRGSFNLYGGAGNSGGGINFRDGRNGANYNPNQ